MHFILPGQCPGVEIGRAQPGRAEEEEEDSDEYSGSSSEEEGEYNTKSHKALLRHPGEGVSECGRMSVWLLLGGLVDRLVHIVECSVGCGVSEWMDE